MAPHTKESSDNTRCASYSHHYTKNIGRKPTKIKVWGLDDKNDNNLDLLAHLEDGETTAETLRRVISYGFPYSSKKGKRAMSLDDMGIHIVRNDQDVIEIHFNQPITLKTGETETHTQNTLTDQCVTDSKEADKHTQMTQTNGTDK